MTGNRIEVPPRGGNHRGRGTATLEVEMHPQSTCSVTDCDSPVHGRGFCKKHWLRWWRHGDVHYVAAPPEHRFWSKVFKTETCWLWTGATNTKGYGSFSVGIGASKTRVGAHAWAYETLIGPVPGGCELDHLCRDHRCVNPAHLEPVPHRVNVLRGAAPSVNAVKALTQPRRADGRFDSRRPATRRCVDAGRAPSRSRG